MSPLKRKLVLAGGVLDDLLAFGLAFTTLCSLATGLLLPTGWVLPAGAVP
ncbi:hypothetical protein ACFY0P_48035 [Streptomyces sp. NPDC001714]